MNWVTEKKTGFIFLDRLLANLLVNLGILKFVLDVVLFFMTKIIIFSFLKEPRHLQFIAEFSDSDVYTLLSAKKVYGAPTDYGFCVKVIQCK